MKILNNSCETINITGVDLSDINKITLVIKINNENSFTEEFSLPLDNTKIEIIDDTLLLKPTIFNNSIKNGIYKIEVIILNSEEENIVYNNCALIDCNLSCKLTTKSCTAIAKSYITLQDEAIINYLRLEALERGSNCNCNCDELLETYLELEKYLNDIENDCNC